MQADSAVTDSSSTPEDQEAMPGYSAKSLTDKLGIKAGMLVAPIAAPAELASWLAPLPSGAKLVGARSGNVGCVLLFVKRRTELERRVPAALARLGSGGMCWICWPKKTSGVATDVTEDLLRRVVLPTGWVDVKVSAVSETWSGLKFLRRKVRV
jgi:hypothetical protein